MIRIANWNLERVLPSQARSSAICNHMAEIDADIWILTETHSDLSPGGKYLSSTSAEPDRVSQPGECWSAIWSRFPIEPLPDFVSDSSRCAAAIIEHPKLGTFIVFSCVLPWHGSTWRGIPSRDSEAFSAALEMYSKDWQRARNAFPKATLVVAGDFNQSLVDWHYYGSRKQRGLLEKAIADNMMTVATAGDFDPIARDSAPCACIDHICISKLPDHFAWKTVRWPEMPRPNKKLSDHFGVAVTIFPK